MANGRLGSRRARKPPARLREDSEEISRPTKVQRTEGKKTATGKKSQVRQTREAPGAKVRLREDEEISRPTKVQRTEGKNTATGKKSRQVRQAREAPGAKVRQGSSKGVMCRVRLRDELSNSASQKSAEPGASGAESMAHQSSKARKVGHVGERVCVHDGEGKGEKEVSRRGDSEEVEGVPMVAVSGKGHEEEDRRRGGESGVVQSLPGSQVSVECDGDECEEDLGVESSKGGGEDDEPRCHGAASGEDYYAQEQGSEEVRAVVGGKRPLQSSSSQGSRATFVSKDSWTTDVPDEDVSAVEYKAPKLDEVSLGGKNVSLPSVGPEVVTGRYSGSQAGSRSPGFVARSEVRAVGKAMRESGMSVQQSVPASANFLQQCGLTVPGEVPYFGSDAPRSRESLKFNEELFCGKGGELEAEDTSKGVREYQESGGFGKSGQDVGAGGVGGDDGKLEAENQNGMKGDDLLTDYERSTFTEPVRSCLGVGGVMPWQNVDDDDEDPMLDFERALAELFKVCHRGGKASRFGTNDLMFQLYRTQVTSAVNFRDVKKNLHLVLKSCAEMAEILKQKHETAPVKGEPVKMAQAVVAGIPGMAPPASSEKTSLDMKAIKKALTDSGLTNNGVLLSCIMSGMKEFFSALPEGVESGQAVFMAIMSSFGQNYNCQVTRLGRPSTYTASSYTGQCHMFRFGIGAILKHFAACDEFRLLPVHDLFMRWLAPGVDLFGYLDKACQSLLSLMRSVHRPIAERAELEMKCLTELLSHQKGSLPVMRLTQEGPPCMPPDVPKTDEEFLSKAYLQHEFFCVSLSGNIVVRGHKRDPTMPLKVKFNLAVLTIRMLAHFFLNQRAANLVSTTLRSSRTTEKIFFGVVKNVVAAIRGVVGDNVFFLLHGAMLCVCSLVERASEGKLTKDDEDVFGVLLLTEKTKSADKTKFLIGRTISAARYMDLMGVDVNRPVQQRPSNSGSGALSTGAPVRAGPSGPSPTSGSSSSAMSAPTGVRLESPVDRVMQKVVFSTAPGRRSG